MKKIIPHNTDKDGCALTIKAGYFKMGAANFLRHSDDVFKATCIIEIYETEGDIRAISEQRQEGESGQTWSE